MLRTIIHIDRERCNGCGLCVRACHEGAIGLVDGKAKLLRDDYCDGLGDCLPACPTGAITFETREAAAYDELAVAQAKRRTSEAEPHEPHEAHEPHESHEHREAHEAHHHAGGCPGSAPRTLEHRGCPGSAPRVVAQSGRPGDVAPAAGYAGSTAGIVERPSELTRWPIQIKLAPAMPHHYDGTRLLVAADCTAFAYASMHERFMRGYVTLIGCPKLDAVDYADKLADIIAGSDIPEIHVVRMEVPCCGGIVQAVRRAVAATGKDIPITVSIVSVDGQLVRTDAVA
jgi:NAD-dependent dihydropyrimidine dehydrogenase PreA subunit